MVLRHLLDRNFQLLYFRQKTSYAEIDLLFTKGKKCLLVEVKRSTAGAFESSRISKKQRERQIRFVEAYYFEHGIFPVRILALVEPIRGGFDVKFREDCSWS